jgi:hypothetical protein
LNKTINCRTFAMFVTDIRNFWTPFCSNSMSDLPCFILVRSLPVTDKSKINEAK